MYMLLITFLSLSLSVAAPADGGVDTLTTEEGLIIDLDADHGVVVGAGNRVEKWVNQVESFAIKTFEKRDEGREVKGSGMPLLKPDVAQLNGHSTVAFHQQELVAMDEDALDHLITGSGYTWFCVLKAGKQPGELPDVNSFFGNLRNGGNYEGFCGGLADDNRVWMGSTSGVAFGRCDEHSPQVISGERLKQTDHSLLVGHMEAGTGVVTLSLFINDPQHPFVTHPSPVNIHADASKLAIGQERDAIEHPGVESFVGAIARFLLYDRPLTKKELVQVATRLKAHYNL